jgi:hypothetical protein
LTVPEFSPGQTPFRGEGDTFADILYPVVERVENGSRCGELDGIGVPGFDFTDKRGMNLQQLFNLFKLERNLLL